MAKVTLDEHKIDVGDYQRLIDIAKKMNLTTTDVANFLIKTGIEVLERSSKIIVEEIQIEIKKRLE